MKQQYITPRTTTICIDKPQLLAGSGPDSSDQNNPGLDNSSSSPLFFDEDYE